ncbi:pilus assembly protein PilP [Bdellovibrio sp. HCB2-146]|uniref:pilus assembly protein PilP n=1 Tax=Bdellovibrio sp. HCB2-146 TaxID=3394362 RepID=UPI0039BD20F9
MKSVRWMVSYILVAVVGLGLAFAVSVRFMTPAHSQGAPSNGDLPPEFMKEVESTQVPPPPGQQPPQGQVPPPPTAVPPPPTEPQMQPPPMDQPVGDGATAQQPAPVQQYDNGDDYFYDPTGKRDPFKPFRAVVIRSDKKEVVLEPLQKWELERLQIVGILWEVKTPRAMIKDPDGAVHTIIKNSKIGRNEGYVAVIREGEIVVVETIYEDGKPIKTPRVVEFKK